MWLLKGHPTEALGTFGKLVLSLIIPPPGGGSTGRESVMILLLAGFIGTWKGLLRTF